MNSNRSKNVTRLPSINQSQRTTSKSASKQPQTTSRTSTKSTPILLEQNATTDKQTTSPNVRQSGNSTERPDAPKKVTSTYVQHPQQTDIRRKTFGGKTSLMCQLKVTTIRKEANLIKQTLPLTDDLVEVLREQAIIDAHLQHALKKADITSRWDAVIEFIQSEVQYTVFGAWDFLMKRKDTLLASRMQETFNTLVNQHFEMDLQPLQLNKDRQNKVAKVMLDNLRKADGYVDELNASIREYQIYTQKVSELVKEGEHLDEKSSTSTGSQASSTRGATSRSSFPAVPESIHVIYAKVKTYISNLEEESTEQRDEMERLQIKLYEAHSEIETMENKTLKLRGQIKEQEEQIQSLKKEKEALGQELKETTEELDLASSQNFQFDRKLNEMMNVVMQGMDSLRHDLKHEVHHATDSINAQVQEVNYKMDSVQDNLTLLNDAQYETATRLEQTTEKINELQKQTREKMNLRINIHSSDNDDSLIKTRSDKLRAVTRK